MLTKMNFATPAEYNNHLIENLTEITLEKYFKQYHEQFYPNQDISFMDYFLEIYQKKHEFCVPHTKLFEYGVISSTSDSNNIRNRLDKLKLKNDIHFILQKVLVVRQDRGSVEKHMYMLKPKAFKKLLMRAGKNSKQTIDVEIYADYYLLLEDVHTDYTEYERGYNKRVNNMLKQEKSILIEKIDDQTSKINDLIEMNKNQSNRMDTILKYSEEVKEELHEVKLELIDIKAQLLRVISVVVSLAYMPNIYKRFYERDHGDKKVRDGKPFSLTSVGKTKTLVFIATYMPATNQLKIECINRKLSEPFVQINKVIERAEYANNQLMVEYCEELDIEPVLNDEIREATEDQFQQVLMPKSYGVSTINEQEVRSTFSKLTKKSPQFKEVVDDYGISNITWSTKFKALILSGVDSLEIAQECFDKFITANRTYNIHSYDQSLEKSLNESGEKIAPESLTELKRRNIEFVDNAQIAVDTFYRKMYVCDNFHTTYLRLRRNPKSTIDELKKGVRNLVIDGVNFD